MSYDGITYLDDWAQHGKFPEIHDAIFDLFVKEVTPDVGLVLDLGSSTGLLSRRMADAGFKVAAIEADTTALAKGLSYGLYGGEIDVKRWKILGQDYDELVYWLSAKGVKAIMARRVLPEMDNSGMGPGPFAKAALEAGVRHLFLEGRAPRVHTAHRLDCLAREVLEINHWEPAKFDGPHRVHLVPRVGA